MSINCPYPLLSYNWKRKESETKPGVHLYDFEFDIDTPKNLSMEEQEKVKTEMHVWLMDLLKSCCDEANTDFTVVNSPEPVIDGR
jgi:hypothetical protein